MFHAVSKPFPATPPLGPASGRSLRRAVLHLGLALVAGLLAAGPAAAQSVGSAIDQPTPGTLPAGTDKAAEGGRVAPPGAIRSSTDVMRPDGSVQGTDGAGRTDPLKHLPANMR